MGLGYRRGKERDTPTGKGERRKEPSLLREREEGGGRREKAYCESSSIETLHPCIVSCFE